MNDLISGTTSGMVLSKLMAETYMLREIGRSTEKKRWHGISKAKSISQKYLRKCSLWFTCYGICDENYIEETVLKTLQQAALWNELKDK
jgi:ABC-type phosphate transport system ATPase subunit